MEKADIILDTSKKLFMSLGIKAVSMDDVAKEAGISKKTLYSYFKDKRELVYKTIERHFDSEQSFCQNTYEKELHPILQIIGITKHLLSTVKSTNPVMVSDLQRYYPKSWDLFREYREEYILQFMKENLLQGQKQGVYRGNFNAQIVAELYVNNMNLVASRDFMYQDAFRISETIKEIIHYHMHGICTPIGLSYYEEQIKPI